MWQVPFFFACGRHCGVDCVMKCVDPVVIFRNSEMSLVIKVCKIWRRILA